MFFLTVAITRDDDRENPAKSTRTDFTGKSATEWRHQTGTGRAASACLSPHHSMPREKRDDFSTTG
jgi:hypothetical protein